MVNVCYCGNRKVFPMLLLSLLSIAEHTKEPIAAYVLTMDCTEINPDFLPLTEGQREILQSALRERNPESGVTLIRADEEYNEELRGGKNENNYYTPYAMLRLLVTRFEMPARVLYLDVDVMCCGDITQLTSIDIGGYEFAAVRDHMGRHFFGRDYFNSGVMYWNLEKIKETGLFERACEMVVKRKMMFTDQGALNRCARAKLLLPRKFNEQRNIRQDTVLKHFCRGIKWFPFFRVYNIKQTERDKVHKELKINEFDDIYRQFDELAERYDLK